MLGIREEVLPKSPSARAVRYALNQWEALTRYLEDGDLEIDNGATERANRDIAIGRGNWTFFGSNNGGNTAAVFAELYRDAQTECSRAIRLVPGRANPLGHPSHPSDRRITSAQLADPRHRPQSLKSDDHPRAREATPRWFASRLPIFRDVRHARDSMKSPECLPGRFDVADLLDNRLSNAHDWGV